MGRAEILLLVYVLIASISFVALAEDCTYIVKFKTGTRADSGTDSLVGVVLADKSGKNIEFINLGASTGHDNFEKGDLDVFGGIASCLPGPICYMKLTSNGSGNKPGWYVAFVEVETYKDGGPSEYYHFSVNQWLALDEKPYQLYAVRDKCSRDIQKIGYSIV